MAPRVQVIVSKVMHGDVTSTRQACSNYEIGFISISPTVRKFDVGLFKVAVLEILMSKREGMYPEIPSMTVFQMSST